MYCRFRYAAAPSWTARAISRMRSLPSGCASSQTVRPIPYATATAAQMSANSTAWSLKKLPTISVPTPSQGQRRVAPARAGFYHMQLLRCVGVGQLQIRGHLLEVAQEFVGHRPFQHRQQRPEPLDRQPCLVELAVVVGELPVAEGGKCVERLYEEVGDLELLQFLLELSQHLFVVWLGRLRHAGCQSSKRFPSGSTAQPKRPNSISCTFSSTSTPALRSCPSIASRSRTRKLTISCCSGRPKYSVSAAKGAHTI